MNYLATLSSSEIARYSRQLLLEQVGMEAQQRLRASSVLCIGTGGLGAPLLMYPAAAGGRAIVITADVKDREVVEYRIVELERQLGPRTTREVDRCGRRGIGSISGGQHRRILPPLPSSKKGTQPGALSFKRVSAIPNISPVRIPAKL